MKKSCIKTGICFFLAVFFLMGSIFHVSGQTDEVNLFGDVNSDQAIDIVDALMVAQYYVGIYSESFNENTADVNIDLNIDIVDALMIAQHYVGLIPVLPGDEKYDEYQKQLAEAKEKWQGLGVSHYEYIFQAYCFCPQAGIQFLIEVESDNIVSVLNLQEDTYLPEDELSLYYTINGLFDIIQSVLDRKGHIVELEFHEIYSYPTIINVDPIIMAVDDEYTYNMSGFRSLKSIRIVPAGSNTQQGDPFGLKSASVTGDILTLSIDYSGGCMDHMVSVNASDAFLESYPPQVDCTIQHDDPGDPCDAIVTQSEGFDLTPLAELYMEMYQSTGTLILNIYSFDGEKRQLEYIISPKGAG